MVDFIKTRRIDLGPGFIDSKAVERVSCIKAHQPVNPNNRLRRGRLHQSLLMNSYWCTVESILTYCITVWSASSIREERMALHRVIKKAQCIMWCQLPAAEDIYRAWCQGRASTFIFDPTNPANHLFILLRSSRRYRTIYELVERLTALVNVTLHLMNCCGRHRIIQNMNFSFNVIITTTLGLKVFPQLVKVNNTIIY